MHLALVVMMHNLTARLDERFCSAHDKLQHCIAHMAD